MKRRNEPESPNTARRNGDRRDKPRAAAAVLNGMPDRMWGGPGVGLECVICGEPIPRDQTELELEFRRDGGKESYHVHVPCFQRWTLQQPERESSETANRGLSDGADSDNIRLGGVGGPSKTVPA